MCPFRRSGDGPQALAYAENFIGDPCVAVNLLEEAAATVSEAVRAKETAQISPIRDMRAYLYRAFLRRIGEGERNQARLQEALEDDLRFGETMSVEARGETKLVLKQVLSMCDRKTRAIIWGRIEGRSWDEISYDVALALLSGSGELAECACQNGKDRQRKLWVFPCWNK